MIRHRDKTRDLAPIEPACNTLGTARLPSMSMRKGKAFTLIELLVAVVILSLMITMVSMILSQSQKVVNVAQARIRSNGAAANIAEMIRQDLRSVSKNGILCITDTSQADRSPRMLFTTAGVAHSVTGTTRGTGAFIAYGQVANQADAGNPANRILWRPGWVLTASPDAGTQPWMDIWQLDFSTLQGYTRQQVNKDVINNSAFTGAVGNLRVPPNTMTEINRLWQVATTGCSRLSIMWTDGNTAGGLRWYGRDINGNLNPKDGGWTGRNSTNLDDPANLSTPEYDGSQSGTDGVYRVLWTHHNQSAWPKAIKVRFALRDPAMPAEFQDVDYEVIATLGQ